MPAPVRPQVACVGTLISWPSRPASTVIPRFAASSVRLTASTTGSPRSLHAMASGRWRDRLPASATTSTASGAAPTSSSQNGWSPVGSSSSERVPGRSTSQASAPSTVTGTRSSETVVPGALAVSTNRRLARATNVDLPTFGRPTRAMTGRPGSGPTAAPAATGWQPAAALISPSPPPRQPGRRSVPSRARWRRGGRRSRTGPTAPGRAPPRPGRQAGYGQSRRRRRRAGGPRARAPRAPPRRRRPRGGASRSGSGRGTPARPGWPGDGGQGGTATCPQ